MKVKLVVLFVAMILVAISFNNSFCFAFLVNSPGHENSGAVFLNIAAKDYCFPNIINCLQTAFIMLKLDKR